jgi:DNA-binding CsgD family transcriptional regulator
MEDLLIAYYLVVIMIGFAALAIAGFWAVKTRDPDLRNFCIVYALFTLLLIVSVFRKYLSLNVEGYSPRDWYNISGVYLIINSLIMPAFIHFLLGIYQVRHRTLIAIIILVITLLSIGLLYSPLGAVLDEGSKVIHFGVGYPISSAWYLVSFTFALLLGYGSLPRFWNSEQRNLIVGLLIFATFGYVESLLNAPNALRTGSVAFGEEREFLYSSIPYALFGLFLIYHFLRFSPQTPIGLDSLSESFLSAYGITDREREIIEKVIEGKSNSTIADELFISLATVKTHLHNIYTKIGVESRFDLLARVRSGK